MYRYTLALFLSVCVFSNSHASSRPYLKIQYEVFEPLSTTRRSTALGRTIAIRQCFVPCDKLRISYYNQRYGMMSGAFLHQGQWRPFSALAYESSARGSYTTGPDATLLSDVWDEKHNRLQKVCLSLAGIARRFEEPPGTHTAREMGDDIEAYQCCFSPAFVSYAPVGATILE